MAGGVAAWFFAPLTVHVHDTYFVLTAPRLWWPVVLGLIGAVMGRWLWIGTRTRAVFLGAVGASLSMALVLLVERWWGWHQLRAMGLDRLEPYGVARTLPLLPGHVNLQLLGFALVAGALTGVLLHVLGSPD